MPYRVLRFISFYISNLVYPLLMRDVPVQSKYFAEKILRILVPKLVMKYPGVVNIQGIAKLARKLGLEPPRERSGVPKWEIVVDWYLGQFGPREDEGMIEYYDRLGTATLVVLSDYMFASFGSSSDDWIFTSIEDVIGALGGE